MSGNKHGEKNRFKNSCSILLLYSYNHWKKVEMDKGILLDYDRSNFLEIFNAS